MIRLEARTKGFQLRESLNEGYSNIDGKVFYLTRGKCLQLADHLGLEI